MSKERFGVSDDAIVSADAQLVAAAILRTISDTGERAVELLDELIEVLFGE